MVFSSLVSCAVNPGRAAAGDDAQADVVGGQPVEKTAREGVGPEPEPVFAAVLGRLWARSQSAEVEPCSTHFGATSEQAILVLSEAVAVQDKPPTRWWGA